MQLCGVLIPLLTIAADVLEWPTRAYRKLFSTLHCNALLQQHLQPQTRFQVGYDMLGWQTKRVDGFSVRVTFLNEVVRQKLKDPVHCRDTLFFFSGRSRGGGGGSCMPSFRVGSEREHQKVQFCGGLGLGGAGKFAAE